MDYFARQRTYVGSPVSSNFCLILTPPRDILTKFRPVDSAIDFPNEVLPIREVSTKHKNGPLLSLFFVERLNIQRFFPLLFLVHGDPYPIPTELKLDLYFRLFFPRYAQEPI